MLAPPAGVSINFLLVQLEKTKGPREMVESLFETACQRMVSVGFRPKTASGFDTYSLVLPENHPSRLQAWDWFCPSMVVKAHVADGLSANPFTRESKAPLDALLRRDQFFLLVE